MQQSGVARQKTLPINSLVNFSSCLSQSSHQQISNSVLIIDFKTNTRDIQILRQLTSGVRRNHELTRHVFFDSDCVISDHSLPRFHRAVVQCQLFYYYDLPMTQAHFAASHKQRYSLYSCFMPTTDKMTILALGIRLYGEHHLHHAISRGFRHSLGPRSLYMMNALISWNWSQA